MALCFRRHGFGPHTAIVPADATDPLSAGSVGSLCACHPAPHIATATEEGNGHIRQQHTQLPSQWNTTYTMARSLTAAHTLQYCIGPSPPPHTPAIRPPNTAVPSYASSHYPPPPQHLPQCSPPMPHGWGKNAFSRFLMGCILEDGEGKIQTNHSPGGGFSKEDWMGRHPHRPQGRSKRRTPRWMEKGHSHGLHCARMCPKAPSGCNGYG